MSLIPREIILLRNRMLWLIYGGIYPGWILRLLGGELRRDGGFLFKDLCRILEIGIEIFIGIFTR